MPGPFVLFPSASDGADTVEAAIARRAAWEQLSKAELVALAVQYSKVITERSRQLARLERRIARQRKGK